VGLAWRGDNDSEELGRLGGHRSVSTLPPPEVALKTQKAGTKPALCQSDVESV
jgi:hypothetical protein